MPPQIKQDLNRSGWETTDFPSVCENCLPENNYVQMLKSDHDAVSYPNLQIRDCLRSSPSAVLSANLSPLLKHFLTPLLL
jgi:hypothetical protein